MPAMKARYWNLPQKTRKPGNRSPAILSCSIPLPLCGPPTSTSLLTRQEPPASTLCWMRTFSGWPGRNTVSAPGSTMFPPTRRGSAYPAWLRKSPRFPHAGCGYHGTDYSGIVLNRIFLLQIQKYPAANRPGRCLLILLRLNFGRLLRAG